MLEIEIWGTVLPLFLAVETSRIKFVSFSVGLLLASLSPNRYYPFEK